MRTEKAEGPPEPGNNRKQRAPGARPKRAGEKGPLGFGSVMRDVRGGNKGEGGGGGGGGAGAGAGAALPGSTTVGMPGFDPAQLQAAQLDAGTKAASQMGAVKSGEALANDASMGVRDPSEALAAQDKSVTHQAQVQPHVPTPLGRMTPSALLATVLDEATKLEIAEAMKELHVELEPEDLGPLIVRLRKGPDGALDISFLAREGEAARVLESGSELLRERLAEAGYANVAIDVRHDADLRLTGVTTGH